MLINELLAYLFDDQPHLLSESMKTWISSSRRFAAFVNTFRDKIRKKLRVIQDQETLHDIKLELETAYLLLKERNLSVAYEPEHARPGRSPDFAVTYTTSLTFMVEVTRMRRTAKAAIQSSDNGIPLEEERLADAICSKLDQLLHRRSNVLIVGVDVLHWSQNDLQALMLRVQQRAEARESTLWQRFGFRERADFFRHYQRLSEVLVRETLMRPHQLPVVWVNPQAKHPLPGKVRTALYRGHTGA